MRLIKLIDSDGQPIPPLKDGQTHDHAGDGHRCISPYFGLYVAVGIVVAGWAGWKLLAAMLS